MTAAEISNLEDHLGYWLRAVSNAVSHSFARRLLAVDITVAEWAFMRVLWESDMKPSTMAERMGLTKGAITKLADRLIAKGLVRRGPDPQDGRAQVLGLTDAGRGKVPGLAALADENDAACFAVLDADERARLDGLLKSLAARLGLTAIPTE